MESTTGEPPPIASAPIAMNESLGAGGNSGFSSNEKKKAPYEKRYTKNTIYFFF